MALGFCGFRKKEQYGAHPFWECLRSISLEQTTLEDSATVICFWSLVEELDHLSSSKMAGILKLKNEVW